jgi:hypothetical protein
MGAMMTRCALLVKTSHADLLREMVGPTDQLLAKPETQGPTGTACGERSSTTTATWQLRRTGGVTPIGCRDCAKCLPTRAILFLAQRIQKGDYLLWLYKFRWDSSACWIH